MIFRWWVGFVAVSYAGLESQVEAFTLDQSVAYLLQSIRERCTAQPPVPAPAAYQDWDTRPGVDHAVFYTITSSRTLAKALSDKANQLPGGNFDDCVLGYLRLLPLYTDERFKAYGMYKCIHGSDSAKFKQWRRAFFQVEGYEGQCTARWQPDAEQLENPICNELYDGPALPEPAQSDDELAEEEEEEVEPFTLEESVAHLFESIEAKCSADPPELAPVEYRDWDTRPGVEHSAFYIITKSNYVARALADRAKELPEGNFDGCVLGYLRLLPLYTDQRFKTYGMKRCLPKKEPAHFKSWKKAFFNVQGYSGKCTPKWKPGAGKPDDSVHDELYGNLFVLDLPAEPLTAEPLHPEPLADSSPGLESDSDSTDFEQPASQGSGSDSDAEELASSASSDDAILDASSSDPITPPSEASTGPTIEKVFPANFSFGRPNVPSFELPTAYPENFKLGKDFEPAGSEDHSERGGSLFSSEPTIGFGSFRPDPATQASSVRGRAASECEERSCNTTQSRPPTRASSSQPATLTSGGSSAAPVVVRTRLGFTSPTTASETGVGLPFGRKSVAPAAAKPNFSSTTRSERQPASKLSPISQGTRANSTASVATSKTGNKPPIPAVALKTGSSSTSQKNPNAHSVFGSVAGSDDRSASQPGATTQAANGAGRHGISVSGGRPLKAVLNTPTVQQARAAAPVAAPVAKPAATLGTGTGPTAGKNPDAFGAKPAPKSPQAATTGGRVVFLTGGRIDVGFNSDPPGTHPRPAGKNDATGPSKLATSGTPPLAKKPISGNVPPARQTPPPARQTPPPARQTPPPARQTPPPANQTPPPANQTPPPARQQPPPPRTAPVVPLGVPVVPISTGGPSPSNLPEPLYGSSSASGSSSAIGLEKMTYEEFCKLTKEQLARIRSEELVKASFLGQLTKEQVTSLSNDVFTDFGAKEFGQLSSLTFLLPTQWSQVGAKRSEQSETIHPAKIMSEVIISSLSPLEIEALSEDFLMAMPEKSWSGLSSTQFAAISHKLAKFDAKRMTLLTPSAFLGFTKEHIKSLGSALSFTDPLHPRYGMRKAQFDKMPEQVRSECLSTWFKDDSFELGRHLYGSWGGILGWFRARFSL